MIEASPSASEPSASSYKVVAKAAGKGLLVWLLYVVLGAFASWLMFALSCAWLLWRDDSGASGGGAGLVLVLFGVLYGVGLPILYALLGQPVALRAALQYLLRERSAALSQLALRAAWPVCELLANKPALSVAAVAAELDRRIEAMSAGAMRWLLKKATRAVKLPELLSGADFLGSVNTQPGEAREKLRVRLASELQQRASGPLYVPFATLLGATVVLAIVLCFVVLPRLQPAGGW